ncbi:Got1/Sft2-like family-domain-containing protein [Kickxella alabastrina]|uniref:Got1/Sft2-like family-domain-containing protein n=1 Tax=Kickxella alabastrina TaxID=61397 RepID=UPI0022203E3A|nr:Got1/Sft2-like family-domain-containing protein [Kickxella alabastrina]KAI7820717.1 Got1/Sft2-like family-domain-containing protein [Kickxella alabastrina]
MSSFRDALAGLKTSSSSPGTHLLPTRPRFQEAAPALGASNLASSTGSAISGLTQSSSDAPVTTQGEWFGLTLMQRWMGFAGGPRAHTRHLLSRERLLFSATYFGSVFFTLFFSAIAHSYLGTLFFVVIQVVALVWYVVSYFPGGSAGLQSTTMTLAGSARTLLPF